MNTMSFAVVGTSYWTCPPGVYSVLARGCGGGSGGAGGSRSNGTIGTAPGGGGGGGSGLFERWFQVVPGTVYPIVIGAGGAGGAGASSFATGGLGGAGTATTFNSFTVANGGFSASAGSPANGSIFNSYSLGGAGGGSGSSSRTIKTFDGLTAPALFASESGGGGGPSMCGIPATFKQQAAYEFTMWNPSGTGPVTTDASGYTQRKANVSITPSFGSGILTLTFARSGLHMVSLIVGHTHSAAYGMARMQLVVGGTATNYAPAFGNLVWGTTAEDTDNWDTVKFLVDVTAAGQTLTLRPRFETNSLSGLTTDHDAYANVFVEPLGDYEAPSAAQAWGGSACGKFNGGSAGTSSTDGVSYAYSGGGGGGAGFGGVGASGGNSHPTTPTSGASASSTAYGAGGGGGGSAESVTAGNGGSGAGGYIELWW